MLSKRFIKKIERDVKALVNEPVSIKKIILFGSCARDSIRSTSDVDLLVVSDKSLSRDERNSLRWLLDEEIGGVETDLVFYSEELYCNDQSTFTRKLREEGIILWEEGVFSEYWNKLLCDC